ncbi:MAG: TspO/MBR family protein [Candidatus Hodarchaeota archaeon]
MENIDRVKLFKLIFCIVICQLAGIIGSIATAPAIPNWYQFLNKPSFTPPSWLFAPVWISLYTLMGIATFIIWNKGLEELNNKIGLIFFSIQLVLNALWSIIFFGLKSILGGLILIITLDIAVVITIILYYKVSKIAGALLIPYIVWLSIATALNYSILLLNPLLS